MGTLYSVNTKKANSRTVNKAKIKLTEVNHQTA
jgi:hypothetical protein